MQMKIWHCWKSWWHQWINMKHPTPLKKYVVLTQQEKKEGVASKTMMKVISMSYNFALSRFNFIKLCFRWILRPQEKLVPRARPRMQQWTHKTRETIKRRYAIPFFSINWHQQSTYPQWRPSTITNSFGADFPSKCPPVRRTWRKSNPRYILGVVLLLNVSIDLIICTVCWFPFLSGSTSSNPRGVQAPSPSPSPLTLTSTGAEEEKDEDEGENRYDNEQHEEKQEEYGEHLQAPSRRRGGKSREISSLIDYNPSGPSFAAVRGNNSL